MEKFLDVDTKTKWGQWPVSGERRVYVRRCYDTVFSLCQTAWAAGIQGIFVKGTPGIGKSFFLNYALYRLVAKGKTVLLLSGPMNVAYVYKNLEERPTVVKLDEATKVKVADGMATFLAASTDYVLYDPHEDPQKTQRYATQHFCEKPFLVAVSPDPANCKKLEKDTNQAATLYMGPMDSDEAEEMRQLCYSTLTKEQVNERYSNVGGVARFLYRSSFAFSEAEDATLNAIHDHQAFALNDLVVNPRRIDAGSVENEYKSLWSLYHLVPDESHTKYTIELCCRNAYMKLRSHLLKRDVQWLWNVFSSTAEKHGTLREIRFEAYARKKIIVEGVDLPARRLLLTEVSASETVQVSIPGKPTVYEMRDNNIGSTLLSQHAAIVHTGGGGYLIPDLPKVPVIDSAYVAASGKSIMLQMKAGRGKPLSPKSGEIAKIFGDTFVFVVPNEDAILKALPGGTPELKQYVMVLRENAIV